ncbi:uncharacterized protein LOC106463626, partial [Limulus polyphemus]|uniref:Uncharacterized protein LOC106463626 n=1 Tax=Limulus polyphemus TaxID=6850 RepID=A0ABM1SUG4_LIMPO
MRNEKLIIQGFIFLTAVVTVLSGYAPLPVDDLSEPIPYDTGFNVQDELGTSLSRQESGDGNGNVQGSYGYIDPNGVWREVKYTAGVEGFQASILTNEPGTSNQSPADVQVSAQEPPAGLQPIEVPAVRPKVVLPAYKKVIAAPAPLKVRVAAPAPVPAFSVPVRPALKYSAPAFPYAAPAPFLKTLKEAGLGSGNFSTKSDMLSKAVILLCLVAGTFAGYLPAVAPAYDINIPTPYDTGYDTVDEYGTRQSRQESGDGNGRVQGSYGYTDPWGTSRLAMILLCLVAGTFAGYLPAAAPAYDINIPTPYDTGYDTVDEYGTRQSRQESGDGNGRVQGSYGYTDPWGTSRQVNYVADEGGFRAWISTNEAGTDNQN